MIRVFDSPLTRASLPDQVFRRLAGDVLAVGTGRASGCRRNGRWPRSSA